MTSARLDRLRDKLSQDGLEALLITYSHNRKYVSGFTGSSGMLLVTEQDSWLLTDFRYMTQAAEQAPAFDLIEHAAKPIVTVRDLLESKSIHKLAFEQDHVTYAEFAAWTEQLGSIELQPVSGIVEGLRLIKDEAEIAIVQEAAELADKTFQFALGIIRPGISELEIALEMETFMRKGGASGPSFETIVASGERSALPHGVASERMVGTDEFVKLDFGAYYKGYCSDITRTVVVGTASERHREIYNIVLEAQLHALANIRPGMSGREADALSRDIIARYGYGDNFGHSLGHGIGLEIHEMPRLSKLSDSILTPGMIVTVEPGIYIPGFGGVRIEDDIVITDTGIKILTSSTKELIELRA
ncbi:Xaa-Pro aminopeptidase [Paenibacillus cellulosilyticus]|uniref:Xaa-Pro aminopeptidase n=1 Tax=Paenibacillus cellulosilyticus TaxID=375489 RepID=A0A2V2YWQ8_9BACL|nr:Xaa-Pro peptidase family protein [Paenibacillus cellulosilyticus]PWW05673.1 Xaa-Pro aminopeptidase [Paenibacillus cellulosilyticus]QKS45304.1 aminopeptidase P family protein [Paenibacillus cellulosilyticus]